MARPTRPERPAALRIANGSVPARSTGARSAPNSADPKAALTGPRTEAQADAIRSLCRRGDRDADALVRQRFGIEGMDALSQVQASELIRALNDRNTVRSAAS
jgi:hypothetical protein